jgi:CheY-like chemotaxis protein
MRRLKKEYGAKGIAMCGYGIEEAVQKGEEAGFSDHLAKPVNRAQLEASMLRVARNRTSMSR